MNNVPENHRFSITLFFFKNNGQEVYSSILPALPLISAPFYKIAGDFGIRFFIVLLSIIAVIFFYLYSAKQPDFYIPALFACVAIFLTHPLIFYSSQIYPEIIAAIAIVAFLFFLEKKNFFSSGLSAGLIILFHFKFIPLAFIMAVAGITRIKEKKMSSAIFLFLPVIISITLISIYSKFFYSSFNPFSVYITGSDLKFSGFYEMIKARVFDNSFFNRLSTEFFNLQFGLFVNNPLYILLFIILFIQIKKKIYEYIPFCIIFFGYILFICANEQGYNGFAPLNRLLVPVLPMLIIPFSEFITILIKRCAVNILRFIFIFSFFSYIITLIFIVAPITRYPNFFQMNNIIYYSKVLLKIWRF